jgi:hypothetical protein
VLVELLLKEQRTLGVGETMAMALADLGRFEEAARCSATSSPAPNRGLPPRDV